MKILIADDEPVSLKRVERFLLDLKYEVITCSNGQEVWEELKKDNSLNLFILDWMMPGFDGVELCRRIRRMGTDRYRYLILLTAKDGRDDVVKGLEAGADDYITKPFYPYELKVRLRAARRILELNEELLEARDLLYEKATIDALTGAFNRSAIGETLEKEIERAYRDGEPLTVAMLDIDFFKKVNDTYGHIAGDQVLRETVKRLKTGLRSYDSIGRYGGEEFLLIFPGSSMEASKELAGRLRDFIGEIPIDTSEGLIVVTVSIGLGEIEAGKRESASELINRADRALYQAKEKGRNRVEEGLTPVE